MTELQSGKVAEILYHSATLQLCYFFLSIFAPLPLYRLIIDSMHANVKALTHWAIYKGYKMRITQRSEQEVQGVFTTNIGSVPFRYNAAERVVYLENGHIQINEYGWEIAKSESQS